MAKKVEDLALMLTDSHLKEDTVDINLSIWRQAIQECKKRGLDQIYHLGDAFNSRKAQSILVLNTFNQILQELHDAGIHLNIIPGNHDKTDYQSEDSFLDPFMFHPGVNIWPKGDVSRLGDNLSLFQMPFFDEKSGKYGEIVSPLLDIAIQEKKSGRVNILLTHIGVNEAVMNGGSVIEGHLDGSMFDVFDKVYVGHFHDYQELRKGKIVYMGSCYQANFGEDSKKGFQILKTDGSIEFVQTEFPRFIKVPLNIDKVSKEDLTEIKKEYEGSTDNIRLEFTGSKESLKKVDRREFESLGIDVKTKEESVEVVDHEDDVSTFTNESIRDEWLKFTDEDKETQEKGLKYLEPLIK